MRITSKGQVTIPQAIREKAGFLPYTAVEFVIDGEAVRIVKAAPVEGAGRGAEAVLLLTGSANTGMSTDEIMALTRGQ